MQIVDDADAHAPARIVSPRGDEVQRRLGRDGIDDDLLVREEGIGQRLRLRGKCCHWSFASHAVS